MKLDQLKLCNETKCQEIFDGPVCPKCGSIGTLLTTWLPPMCSAKVRVGGTKAVVSAIASRKQRSIAHA